MNTDIFVSCKCGCNNTLVVRKFDDVYYLSFLSDDFFTNQHFFTYMYKLKDILLGNKILKDIVLEEKDVCNLINALSAPCSTKKVENHSYIKVNYDTDYPNENMFFLNLYSRLSIKEIVTGKYYKAFEITLNESERLKLIRHLKMILKRSKLCIKKNPKI